MAIQQSHLTSVSSNFPASSQVHAPVRPEGEYRSEKLVLLVPDASVDTNNLEEVSVFLQGRRDLKDRRIDEEDFPEINTLKELEDAAEELTFEAAEHKKPEKEEKIDQEQRVQETVHAAHHAESEDLLQKLPDLNKEQLEQAISNVMRGDSEASPKETLLKFLASFTDVTHQYAALLELKKEISKAIAQMSRQSQTNNGVLNYFSQLNGEMNFKLKELIEELGSQIKAGINVSLVAQKFVKEFELTQLGELRQLYRDCVLNYEVLWEVYKRLVKKFGRKNFKKSCGFLEESLLADMESEGSSIPKEKLSAILKDIYQLRVLSQMHKDSDTLFLRLKKKYFLADQGQETLSEGIVELFDGAMTQSGIDRKVDRLIQQLHIRHLAAKINLLTGIKHIVRQVPTAIFKTDNERIRALEVIQKQLDVVIEQECEDDG